jgi:predicted nucleic acid-binding protein
VILIDTDVLIAAMALSNKIDIMTYNVKDFRYIEGLVLFSGKKSGS